MVLPSEPLSRQEKYLNKIATGEGEIPSKPMSRNEQYLAYICENGGVGGGGSSDRVEGIEATLNEHLNNHPLGMVTDWGEIVDYPTIKHHDTYKNYDYLICLDKNNKCRIFYFEKENVNSVFSVGTYLAIEGSWYSKSISNTYPLYDFSNTTFESSKNSYSTSFCTKHFTNNEELYNKLKNNSIWKNVPIALEKEGLVVKQSRTNSETLASYKGFEGQLIINTDTNQLHLMDGITVGGHIVGVNIASQTNLNDLEERVLALEKIVNSLQV